MSTGPLGQGVASAVGMAFAFANAALFALYIVLAHRVAQHAGMSGIDGLAAAMLIAIVGYMATNILALGLVIEDGVAQRAVHQDEDG